MAVSSSVGAALGFQQKEQLSLTFKSGSISAEVRGVEEQLAGSDGGHTDGCCVSIPRHCFLKPIDLQLHMCDFDGSEAFP